MTAVVYGVEIDNPAGVWTELKNAQMRLKEKGWVKTWYDGNSGMCLANALRFVVHGNKNAPMSFPESPILVAEELTYAVIEQHAPEFAKREEFRLAVARGRNPYTSIPAFNDEGDRVLEDVLRVLDMALAAVKPLAFQHSVTMATEVMTPEEQEEIRLAVREDFKSRFSSSWKRWLKSDKSNKSANPVVQEFTGWLDSFEERGWDTFWDELADCETPECEEMRKELLGV